MVWTPDQAARFLYWTEEHDPDLYPLYAFVLRRGLRRGEAAGIRTDQIDMIDATATVTHQIAAHGYQPIYKKVKTRNGDRVVALDTDTLADFTAYNTRRTAWKNAAGARWPNTVSMPTPAPCGGYTTIDVDIYFRQPDGRPWHPHLIFDRFERAAHKQACHPSASTTAATPPPATQSRRSRPHRNQRTPWTLQHHHHQRHLHLPPTRGRTHRERRTTAENTAKIIKRQRRS